MGKVNRCDVFADAPCNVKEFFRYDFYYEVIYTHHTDGKAKACENIGEDHVVIAILSFAEHTSLKVNAKGEIHDCDDKRRERKG